MKGEGKIIEAWPRLLKKPLKSDANVIPMGNGEKEMFVGRIIMADLDAVWGDVLNECRTYNTMKE